MSPFCCWLVLIRLCIVRYIFTLLVHYKSSTGLSSCRLSIRPYVVDWLKMPDNKSVRFMGNRIHNNVLKRRGGCLNTYMHRRSLN